MKLDRNIPGNEGRGKYALLLLRKLISFEPTETFGTNPIMDAIKTLDDAGIIDWGIEGSDSEFMVMRLKDRHSEAGLAAYGADAWRHGDREFAREIWLMADRAGPHHPGCKLPD
jgi:hypothetical protein